MKIVVSASNGMSLVNFRGNLIRDMIARGHEVICFSCEDDEETRTSVKALGADYRMIPMSRTGTSFGEDLKTMREYRKALCHIKPDMYFAYMSKPIAYGCIAAKKAGVKKINVLVTGLEIAFYSGGLKNAIVRSVLKYFFKKAHRISENIIFQNPDDLKRFADMGIVEVEKTTVVGGSGVDMERFEKKSLPDKPVFAMIARLVWSKGIREFLSAVKVLKEKYPESEVILVGMLDNNDESLTEAELNKCIAENDIEYHGFAKDVRPFLERCSVFVLPSYHEGTPRSVLEAMSTGRAIITSDAPGCRETVIDGENGYLVPVGDHVTLADRMCRLAGDSALREKMAYKSYEFCREKFDVVKVNKTMLDKMGL